MGFKLTLKMLRRNGFMPILLAAQVVFAVVVLVNVGSMLGKQLAPVLASTGVPAGQVLLTRQIHASAADMKQWSYANVREAERAVRAMPGVEAVSVGVGLPFTADGAWMRANPTSVSTHRTLDADVFAGDHTVAALGLRVVRGRGFSPDDYVRGGFSAMWRQPRAVLLTQSLARRLFPGEAAVGQAIWLSDGPGQRDPLQVIGVVNDTLDSRIAGDASAGTHAVVMLPYQMEKFTVMSAIVRVRPRMRAEVARHLPKVLASALGLHGPDAVKVMTYESVHKRAVHGSKLTAWLLAAVMVTVASVVMLGIAGISGFWVQKRMREIGIQRALGASRRDILRQYQLENLMVIAGGAVMGVGIGLMVSAWLRMHFELKAPTTATWIAGSVLLVVLGQLSALGPALRAARVPPVVATRSV